MNEEKKTGLMHCPNCHGAGGIDEHICKMCGGTGYVEGQQRQAMDLYEVGAMQDIINAAEYGDMMTPNLVACEFGKFLSNHYGAEISKASASMITGVVTVDFYYNARRRLHFIKGCMLGGDVGILFTWDEIDIKSDVFMNAEELDKILKG